MERETMEFDVVIIGAGPAGLAAAIRLKQCNSDLQVVVLEKGSEVGAHILSGAVFSPLALNELLPDWQQQGAPVTCAVTEDHIYHFSSAEKARRVPHMLAPRSMHNQGYYIISLANLCRWMAEQAESLGVDIYPGFPATQILYGEDGSVRGVVTGDLGLDYEGNQKDSYEPGMALMGKYVLFAEGSRGHLGKELITRYGLDQDCDPQHYGIGLKELWRVPAEQHQQGLVLHGAGWPLAENGINGGSFLYHAGDNQVSLGLIADLNYSNPHVSPFQELQRFKQHPIIRQYLQGGERISYGARAITKGGLQSLPKQYFPGGLLIGCDAGTLNFSKIKGSHSAMKSGMIAAETVATSLEQLPEGGQSLDTYEQAFKGSWLYDELYRSRNFGAALHRFGLWRGGAFNVVDQNIFAGKIPVTLADTKEDHRQLVMVKNSRPIDYPAPDGVFSFDRLSSVFVSHTNHREDQPNHLQLGDPSRAITVNLDQYDAPEQRYCPAGVYEIITESGQPTLQINAQNCLHCKTCDIKDPTGNITWVPPEGGGGPNYPNM